MRAAELAAGELAAKGPSARTVGRMGSARPPKRRAGHCGGWPATLRSGLLSVPFAGLLAGCLWGLWRYGGMGWRAVAAAVAALLAVGLTGEIGGVRGALAPTSALHDPAITRLLEQLAGSADVRIPELRRSPDEAINAFTTGRLGGRAIIVLSEGLLRRRRDELAAALAHELGHIVHRDVAFLGLERAAMIVLSAPGRLVSWCLRTLVMPRHRRELVGQLCAALLLLLGAVLAALMPVTLALVVAATSRRRELWADDAAVDLLGGAASLAQLLQQLGGARRRRRRWRPLADHPSPQARVRRILRRESRRRQGVPRAPD